MTKTSTLDFEAGKTYGIDELLRFLGRHSIYTHRWRTVTRFQVLAEIWGLNHDPAIGVKREIDTTGVSAGMADLMDHFYNQGKFDQFEFQIEAKHSPDPLRAITGTLVITFNKVGSQYAELVFSTTARNEREGILELLKADIRTDCKSVEELYREARKAYIEPAVA